MGSPRASRRQPAASAARPSPGLEPQARSSRPNRRLRAGRSSDGWPRSGRGRRASLRTAPLPEAARRRPRRRPRPAKPPRSHGAAPDSGLRRWLGAFGLWLFRRHRDADEDRLVHKSLTWFRKMARRGDPRRVPDRWTCRPTVLTSVNIERGWRSPSTTPRSSDSRPWTPAPRAGGGPSAYLLVIAGPSFGEMYQLQGRALDDRPRRHAPTSACSTTASRASTPRSSATAARSCSSTSGSTNGTFCNGDAGQAPRPDRRRQDLRRRVDDPQVHLPGPGRRALSEAAVRVGAARRADRRPSTGATSSIA